jgi:3-phenylpropionate/trans-cinnamate dioxygenase ferredoxin reductase component
MEHYRYLIVGGGMTADAAVDGIREIGKDGSIGIVAAEPDPPYSRPPLSKGLWKGDDPESVWRRTEDKQATVQTGRTVESIDVTGKRVTDDQQAVYASTRFCLRPGDTAQAALRWRGGHLLPHAG